MPGYPFLLIGLLGVLAAPTTQAMDLVAEGGIHSGGDTIISATGLDGATESLKAGDGMSLAVGILTPAGEDYETSVSFGVKKGVIYPGDGSISLIRYPLDGLLLYKQDRLRLGGGLTYHFNPLFKVRRDSQQAAISLRNAIGLLLDARYYIQTHIYIAGRYTRITYETDDAARDRYSGSSVGVMIALQL